MSFSTDLSSRTIMALCLSWLVASAQADTRHDCIAPGVQATFIESFGPSGSIGSLRIVYPGGNEVVYPDEQIAETATPLGRLQTVQEFRLERHTSLLVPDVVLRDSVPVTYTSWLYQTVTPPPGDVVRQRNRSLRVSCTVQFQG